MLKYTAAGEDTRFMGLVHHTDGEREWAYDGDSSVGTLKKALDERMARDQVIMDMKGIGGAYSPSSHELSMPFIEIFAWVVLVVVVATGKAANSSSITDVR